MWSVLLMPAVNALVGALFPNAPGWVGEFLGELLPMLLELVTEADELGDLSGDERLRWVVEHARTMVDEAFDDVPEWGRLSEARRDRIVAGLAELVLFIHSISGKKKRRRVLRRLRRS